MRFVNVQYVFALAAMMLPGCSSGDNGLAEVTGRVTLNGRAVPASVVFQPVDESGKTRGRASSAYSDEAGEFRLAYSAEKNGAELGLHQVQIEVSRRPGDKSINQAMKSTKESQLTRQVSSGKNRFQFALSY